MRGKKYQTNFCGACVQRAFHIAIQAVLWMTPGATALVQPYHEQKQKHTFLSRSCISSLNLRNRSTASRGEIPWTIGPEASHSLRNFRTSSFNSYRTHTLNKSANGLDDMGDREHKKLGANPYPGVHRWGEGAVRSSRKEAWPRWT